MKTPEDPDAESKADQYPNSLGEILTPAENLPAGVLAWLTKWTPLWYQIPEEALPQRTSEVLNELKEHPEDLEKLKANWRTELLANTILFKNFAYLEAWVVAHEIGTSTFLRWATKTPEWHMASSPINKLRLEQIRNSVKPKNIFEDGLKWGALDLAMHKKFWPEQTPENFLKWEAKDGNAEALYLYLVSQSESQASSPLMPVLKKSGTWLKVAESFYPEMLNSSDSDFETLNEQFHEARKESRRKKKQQSVPSPESAKTSDFREIILRHWLPLGLWMMPIDVGLGYLRELGLVEKATGKERTKQRDRVATLVQEKELHVQSIRLWKSRQDAPFRVKEGRVIVDETKLEKKA